MNIFPSHIQNSFARGTENYVRQKKNFRNQN